MSTLLRPLTAIWRALVEYHRTHMSDDPDVVELRKQQQEAERSNRRLNLVEQKYLRGRRP